MPISIKSQDFIHVGDKICTVYLHQTGANRWKIAGEFRGENHQETGTTKAGVKASWKQWAMRRANWSAE